jgi:DNA helicase II / ATP-dependent DNA helicase PcrA
MKQAIKEAGYDPKQYAPSKILSIISRKKGEALNYDFFVRNNTQDLENYAGDSVLLSANRDLNSLILKAWGNYEKILQSEKALDFDDLLLRALEFLKADKNAREHYQNRFKYIHVDEYQDTNKVQYELIELLAGKYRNICVVGDHDQMIYSWRGADLRNILDFEKDYPEAKTVLLEQNYRSTATILDTANTIISKNTLRKPKVLFTKNKKGEKVAVYSAYSEYDEARFIVERVSTLIINGVPAQEIAVLYRANFQSRTLETAFLEAGVHYQVLGTRFFERKEIKDVLSYMRSALSMLPQVAVASNDKVNKNLWPWNSNFGDLERIINIPPRGIGKITLLKLFSGNIQKLSTKFKEKIKDFVLLMSKIQKDLNTLIPSVAVKKIIKITGIEKMLKQSLIEDDEERLENIKELVSLALKYNTIVDSDNKTAGVEAMLSDAALASEQDTLLQNKPAVKLMTVHAAKGLEFEHVFISGLEYGLFPHERSGEQTLVEAEEERRLFYVALTRAKARVWLTHSAVRTIFGSKQVNMPSLFFSDIDNDMLEQIMPSSCPKEFLTDILD